MGSPSGKELGGRVPESAFSTERLCKRVPFRESSGKSPTGLPGSLNAPKGIEEGCGEERVVKEGRHWERVA